MSNPTEKRNLVITRVFDEPIEKVWNAWTDAEYVKQWWGPTGFTAPIAQIDCREGGTSLICMSAPEHGEHYSTWHYLTIVPLQHIEFIHNLADADGNKVDPVTIGMPPDFPQDQRQVVAFKTLGANKTELTITEYDWPVGQMMELSEIGMNQCLDKMASVLYTDDSK